MEKWYKMALAVIYPLQIAFHIKSNSIGIKKAEKPGWSQIFQNTSINFQETRFLHSMVN
jgi:hypothetical protein